MLGCDMCCPVACSPLPFETSEACLEIIPNTPPSQNTDVFPRGLREQATGVKELKAPNLR